MILGLCLILVTALVWTITASAARPPSSPRTMASTRDLDRRTAQLRVCPDRVTPLDLERLLARSLGRTAVARTVGLGAERRIPVGILWGFAERFGAGKLVLALDAEVAERSMRRHLEAGTVPDWRAMTMFATLSRELPTLDVPSDRVVDLDTWSAPTPQPLDLSGFAHLPPISGPGLDAPTDGVDGRPLAA